MAQQTSSSSDEDVLERGIQELGGFRDSTKELVKLAKKLQTTSSRIMFLVFSNY